MEDKLFNAWVAGFWEGEGSIFKKSERRYDDRSYCISINQSIDSNRSVKFCMEKIQSTFGGHIRNQKFSNNNYKLQLHWRLSKREDIINFINAILPYCQIRRKDLENCLTYFRTHPRLDKRDIKIDIKKINNMLDNGKTYVQIAKIIGVLSPSAIWKRLHKRDVLITKEV